MTTSDIANANTSSASLDCQSHGHEIDPDEIIYRKPKTTIGKQQKRVSFHEDTLEMPPEHPNIDWNSTSKEIEKLGISLKSSASSLSRAVGDLSSFECEQEGVEIGKDSSLLGNAGIEELLTRRISEISTSLQKSSRSTSTVYSVKSFLLGPTNHNNGGIPVAERGIPEGQEDPPHRCPTGKKSSSTYDFQSPIVCERSKSSNNNSPGT